MSQSVKICCNQAKLLFAKRGVGGEKKRREGGLTILFYFDDKSPFGGSDDGEN